MFEYEEQAATFVLASRKQRIGGTKILLES
jgi:hypothetical protein